jgi:hypothetical protein
MADFVILDWVVPGYIHPQALVSNAFMGAVYLDQRFPGWASKEKVTELKIGAGEKDVLRQLGLTPEDLELTDEDRYNLGFSVPGELKVWGRYRDYVDEDWGALTRAWSDMIRMRLGRRPRHLSMKWEKEVSTYLVLAA